MAIHGLRFAADVDDSRHEFEGLEADALIELAIPAGNSTRRVDVFLEMDRTRRPARNTPKFRRYDHFITGWSTLLDRYAEALKERPIVVFICEDGDQALEFLLLTAAQTELAAAGVTDTPDVVVADAGYWHLEQMNEITGAGIPVLIPPDSSRRKSARPGWTGGAYDFMRRVLQTERGAELYKQRAQLIEPTFGITKHNRGFVRFHRRGRSAVRTEWRMMATTHNLRRLHQHFCNAG
jgi:hypothetical protein